VTDPCALGSSQSRQRRGVVQGRGAIRVEPLVEGTAVKAGRICAYLWPGLGQCGRARGEKGKMCRVRDHMIFVFYGEASIHCGNVMGSYSVAAKLGRPELDRQFDALKAVCGKPQGKRVDDDGGLDARVMREGLLRVFLRADLPADAGRGLLAQGGGRGPIRLGADEHETRVAAPRETKKADAVGIYVGRGRRCGPASSSESATGKYPGTGINEG
jgi:hypothetical protein